MNMIRNDIAGEIISQLGISGVYDEVLTAVLTFIINLIIALAVFLIGKKVIKIIIKIIIRICKRADLDNGVIGFLTSTAKIVLFVALLIGIAELVGLPTTSFIAILGSAGLAIGLALQGSLSNFAGGVLILILKPFRVDDYIISGGNEGTVISIDVFYTRLRTADNRIIVVPNGTLSNSSVINTSMESERRLDLVIPIGYCDDIEGVRNTLLDIAAKDERILTSKQTETFVSGYGNDAVEVSLRVWLASADYWAVRADLLEKIKYTFDEKGYSIPFHQIDVSIKK